MASPIKSDGGSSTYYDIKLPGWLMAEITKRGEVGEPYIKTEELIYIALGNDFDFGNIQKSLIRAYGASNGAGKEGNDVSYEMNKIQYSADKIKQREGRSRD